MPKVNIRVICLRMKAQLDTNSFQQLLDLCQFSTKDKSQLIILKDLLIRRIINAIYKHELVLLFVIKQLGNKFLIKKYKCSTEFQMIMIKIRIDFIVFYPIIPYSIIDPKSLRKNKDRVFVNKERVDVDFIADADLCGQIVKECIAVEVLPFIKLLIK